MKPEKIILKPVDQLTTDAIGKPGNRVFYVLGQTGKVQAALIIEKVQLQFLVQGIDDFFDRILEKYPHLSQPQIDFKEKEMQLTPPIEPIFHVGDIEIAYDDGERLAVMIAKNAYPQLETEPAEVEYWCTLEQLTAFARWGEIVIQRGRPICPQCGQPMEEGGHFCPKKNGHKRKKPTA